MPPFRPLATPGNPPPSSTFRRALSSIVLATTLLLTPSLSCLAGTAASPQHPTPDAVTEQAAPAPAQPDDPLARLTAQATSGDPRAQLQLGLLHEQGRGVPQDLRRAETLYRQASAKGNVNAMNQLALLIDSGRAGTTDRGEAVRLLRKAAEKGNGLAAYNLGLMLREGRGTNKDWPRAAYWLACADMLGESRAMKDLPPLLRQLSPEQRKKFNARLVKSPLPPRVQPAVN
ncbi:tetratricopeptide repeat protein [Nitratidesulfovibrio liaohensis]|uniref:Sel1 repeat family protein n=1 Tax=Nitratidesulfovibrio liaohensis TaxID=2604158 RepID=A0ABY9R017_9BACT|nr:tetratricopeptide repeat protein [Nitratidesulfovibrio liaohensis]WMW65079.1 sel1 repeat family protein [Nitratidesulfovibrio liaohensis]